MQFDVCNYIKVAMKYILVFVPNLNTQNEEYLVFNNLHETGLKNYLSTCESTQVVSSAPCELRISEKSESVLEGSEGTAEVWKKHFTCYIGEIFGLGGSKCKSYQDFIDTNVKDMSFTIVKVPLSMSLFKKISNLSRHTAFDFTFDDIYDMFAQLFPFKDKQGLCTLAVILHLQKNSDLTAKLKRCYAARDKSKFDEKIKYLSTHIFNSSTNSDSFLSIFNTILKFYSFSDDDEIMVTYQNNEFAELFIVADLFDFSLRFMFTHVNISYKRLIDSADILVELLNDDNFQYPMTLCIEEIEGGALKGGTYGCWRSNNSDSTLENDSDDEGVEFRSLGNSSQSERETLVHVIGLIADDVCSMGERVQKVILELNGFITEFDSSCFSRICSLSVIKCIDCSAKFLASLPCNTVQIVAKFNDSFARSITELYQNATSVQYIGNTFYNNLIFMGRQKHIDIHSSAINGSFTFLQDNDYERISLLSVYGVIYLSGIAGFGQIFLTKTDTMSKLHYEKKEPGQSLFELASAQIYGPIVVDAGIGSVILHMVELDFGTSIVFSGTNKHIEVSESRGLLDVTPYLGTEILVDRNMKLKISSTQDRHSELSQVELSGINFKDNVVLQDVFEKIVLKYVFIDKKSSLTVNMSCKELVIEQCMGVIDLTRVNQLDKVKITFALQEHVRFKSAEPVHVRHLHLHRVCNGIDEMEILFSNFVKIEYLQITDEDGYEYSGDVTSYTQDFKLFFDCEHTEGSSVSSSRYLPHEQSNRLHLISYMKLSLLINSLWCTLVHETIEELDLAAIVVMKENWKSLSSLANLRILKICAENLTAEFFTCLPPGVRLLELSCIATRGKYWNVKDIYCQSVTRIPLPNIRVLVIETNYLAMLRRLSFLPPSLEAIQVRYTHAPIIHSLTTEPKLKIRELYIYDKVENDYSRYSNGFMTEQRSVDFARMLAEHIDFDSLEYLGIVTICRMTVLNPLTFEILNENN